VIDFATRLRDRESLVGYWIASDNAVATELISRVGYDYVCLDMQHGHLGYSGMLSNLLAIDAGATSAPLVRVGANDAATIGRALDAGAVGVIVPLINTVDDAAAAVAACRFPPAGSRSWAPVRASLRVGPDPADTNAAVACLVMIETAQALANVTEICAVPGVDGVYIGPSDLSIALGAPRAGAVEGLPFEESVARIREAAADAGIAVGFHCRTGEVGAQRLAEGFTMVTVSSDLLHLEQAARTHLAAARST
jgi:4-hydroxy-2-oxoheptanedioate aldolase